MSSHYALMGIRFSDLTPPSVGTTLSGENSLPPPFSFRALSPHVAMFAKKKKLRPPLALYFKSVCLVCGMVKKKNKSISLIVIGVAANGSLLPSTNSASIATSMSLSQAQSSQLRCVMSRIFCSIRKA